ncbi:MAG TPA: xylulokinase [Symbiobacteriaceae bacterium]|nr:xylulokinase [Symbiobacteriaceae bacterium]
MAIFLGVDVGTSGARVLAVDASGRLAAIATAEYPLLTPRPGWTEQNPTDWWSAVASCLRQVAAAVPPAEIRAIGLTGQMHGSVFLDAAGEVIRPALLWNDQRTEAECREIEERVGKERLLALCGNRALTGFTAPKVLWLRNHAPEHYARLAHLLLPKDYIRYRLTGDFATDVSDASGTLLLDVAARSWCEPVMKALDLPASMLPRLYEGTGVTGRVSAAAAAATGLPAGLPVVAGGGDQAAGAVGVGLAAPGMASLSLGTSGVVFAACSQPGHLAPAATAPPGLPPESITTVHSFCHAVPGVWHVMGVMLSAGGSLRWARDTLYAGQSYDALTGEAAAVPPGAEGLLFLPYLTGERVPHPDPGARGAFVGLGLRHVRAHLARAVLEGIALGLRDNLDLVRALGVPVQELRVTGGGARSPLWRDILAAALESPLRMLAVDEGPAFGAAILAAAGTSHFADVAAACAAMVKPAGGVPVDAALAEQYARLLPTFRELYLQLRTVFPKLA